jgi:nitrite reductase/ring-hydroxylating ferredoxin subunit
MVRRIGANEQEGRSTDETRTAPSRRPPRDRTACAYLLGREVLVTTLNGEPRAFINVCMRHGGPLALEEDRLTCQWHGSQYDARTGHALLGLLRPGARLIMLHTRVEDGTLIYVYDYKNSEERRESAAAGSCDRSRRVRRLVRVEIRHGTVTN